MQSWLAVVTLALAACGTSYTLDEAEGVDAIRAEFTAHGISTGGTRPLGPLRIDDVEVSFALDGWSLADQLGFEYVSDGDDDFSEAKSDLGGSLEWPKLQTAIDEALVEEPGTHVMVVRTWGHETAELATDQLRRYVSDWLIAHGR